MLFPRPFRGRASSVPRRLAQGQTLSWWGVALIQTLLVKTVARRTLSLRLPDPDAFLGADISRRRRARGSTQGFPEAKVSRDRTEDERSGWLHTTPWSLAEASRGFGHVGALVEDRRTGSRRDDGEGLDLRRGAVDRWSRRWRDPEEVEDVLCTAKAGFNDPARGLLIRAGSQHLLAAAFRRRHRSIELYLSR